MNDLFKVGVISSTHGIAGEVKVYPTTDDPKRFKKLKEVILEPEEDNKLLHVRQVKFAKNMVVLRFEEYNKIEEVQKLIKKSLYVTREHAVPLGENEYYIADLVGLRVISERGEELGVLDSVLRTGANDVYVIKTPAKKEMLIPAIGECIQKVDLEAGIMRIFLMPGLRSLEK